MLAEGITVQIYAASKLSPSHACNPLYVPFEGLKY